MHNNWVTCPRCGKVDKAAITLEKKRAESGKADKAVITPEMERAEIEKERQWHGEDDEDDQLQNVGTGHGNAMAFIATLDSIEG